MKAHGQFKYYSLAKLIGILKSHEIEVLKEAIFSNGPLAFVAKSDSSKSKKSVSFVDDLDSNFPDA